MTRSGKLRAAVGAWLALLTCTGSAPHARGGDRAFEQERRLAWAVAGAERVVTAARAGEPTIEGAALAERSRRALEFLEDSAPWLREPGSSARRPDLEMLAERLRTAAGQAQPARILAPTGTGRISGRVTAAASGAPLSDVGINVYDECGSFVAYGYSDAAGNYVSDALLDTGTYFAKAGPFNTPGYLDQAYAGYNLRPPEYSLLERYTTRIGVTNGLTTANIDFALVSSATLQGRVRAAATLAPVAAADIHVYDEKGRFVRGGRSDEEGSYVVAGLAAGRYLVEVAWNHDQLLPRSQWVTLALGRRTGSVDFDLSAGGTISGEVTSLGQPVPGIPVGVFTSSGALVTREFSDESGRWQTGPGLPSGRYFVRPELRPGPQETLVSARLRSRPCETRDCDAELGIPVRLDAGQAVGSISLELLRGGAVTGVVRAAREGDALQGVRVAVLSEDGTRVAEGVSAASGRYSIQGLPAGSFHLRAEPSDRHLMSQVHGAACPGCSSQGRAVALTEGQVASGIDFSLAAGGTLTGVATTNLGRPLSVGDVRVFDSTGDFFAFSVAANSCPHWETNAGLPAGVYYACYQEHYTERPAYRTQLYSGLDRGEVGTLGDCQPTGGTAISVGPGETVANIDFTGVPPARRKLDVFSTDRAALGVFHAASGLWFLRDIGVQALTVAFGGPGYLPVPADYKGSGTPQVAVYHPASGLWFIRDEVVGTTTSLGFGGGGYLPVPSDYDGDAKADVAVFHPASGLWFIRSSMAGTVMTADFGAGGGFTPVPEDYDGDGRSDLALYHTASGLWFIRRSSTGVVETLGFGGSDYAPVPGDYDADGKTDVAVYHRTLGLWFLRLSTTGATRAIDFGGGPGYTPVPADWDEDSETDLALYHEASGAWYLRRSLVGDTYAVVHGGPGYVPVF